jgi:hypothetical protein
VANPSDEHDPDVEDDEAEDDFDEDAFDDVDDSDDVDQSSPRLSHFERVRSRLLQAQTAKPAPSSRAKATAPRATGPATKAAIERLNERERRLSFAASGASLLFGVMIYLLETNDKHFRLQKGQLTPQTTLVLGIAFAVLLVGVTAYGRRAPVGFVALFAFLMFGTTSFFLGAPFLALAAWLLYRSYKIQKESAAAARAARAEQATTSRTSTSRSGPVTNKSSRSASKSSRSKGPATPEANKRYTPKRPPPPAPKPSRRARRTAQSSD